MVSVSNGPIVTPTAAGSIASITIRRAVRFSIVTICGEWMAWRADVRPRMGRIPGMFMAFASLFERHPYLEVHSIGTPVAKVPAPVEAMPVGQLDHFAHRPALANQRD